MSDIGKRIKLLRESLNLSQSQLARISGIPRPKISRWELGLEQPSAKYLPKLAKALGISVDALLLGGSFEPSTGYLALRLPIVMKVRAGEAMPPSVVYDDTIEVTIEQAHIADAVVIVRGDSMHPELHEGDLCGVRWQDYAAHGQFIVAQIDDFDDLTIKRFVDKGDYFVLEPLNRKYPPYSSKRHRIRILGKVTWVLRYYERP